MDWLLAAGLLLVMSGAYALGWAAGSRRANATYCRRHGLPARRGWHN